MYMCTAVHSSTDLFRAFGRAHHDGDVESPEAAAIRLVDQCPRVHGAVEEGGHLPDIPLQGCVDEPLHLSFRCGLLLLRC